MNSEEASSGARVYFFCVPSEGHDEVPYQHLVVSLAEGLTALGVACFSNVDYWPLDADRTSFLLRHDPSVEPEDCSIVIVSDDWFRTGQPFPRSLTTRSRRACYVALDREDGNRLRTLGPAFQAFDFILRTHYNRSTRYRSNFVPWAYGLSERILRATARERPADEREWEIVANWRHTAHPHSLRLDVERTVLPALRRVMHVNEAREPRQAAPSDPLEQLWWHETGRRHSQAYYDRLMTSAACACFGGFFVTTWPAAKESALSGFFKRALRLARLRTHLVSQWDSWRFWESFSAGCATVHVDLAAYGCVLPVMPVNWTHYIGIDLDRCDEAVQRLRDDPSIVARVGAAGRAWALTHYGPTAIARRLLDLVAARE